MTTPSFRDVKQLSAFLDGQLSQAEKARLEARIQLDPALSAMLAEMRQARAILRRTPKRRLPRNFILSPKMAGIKPPVPRLVPALSWASAAAMLLFILTLGTNMLGQFSFGAAAPMMVAAPMTSEGYGFGGGPAATQPPASDNAQATPIPEASIKTAPETTPTNEPRLAAPAAVPAVKAPPKPINIWLYIWLGLAAVLITAALLIRRASIQMFRRKVDIKHNQ
jgi:anti-sigma factor RsiW